MSKLTDVAICPNCADQFRVKDVSVERVRKVVRCICVNCRETWRMQLFVIPEGAYSTVDNALDMSAVQLDIDALDYKIRERLK